MSKHDTSTGKAEPVRILSGNTFLVQVTWPGTPDKLKLYITEVPRIPFWVNAVWCLLSILKAVFDVEGPIVSVGEGNHVKFFLRKFWTRKQKSKGKS